MNYYNNRWQSTKVIELGSAAFRQWRAKPKNCGVLHGYLLTAKIWVSGTELDDKNWIYDFGGFKEIRKELQEHFDHRTVVAQDDCELEMFKELDKRGVINLNIMEAVGVEKFAEYVFNIANKHIQQDTNGRCWVDQVEVFEHDKNSAIYKKTPVEVTLINGRDIVAEPAPLDTTYTSTDATKDQPGVTYCTPQLIDQHAASVGRTATQGIGNLFGGTRLG